MTTDLWRLPRPSPRVSPPTGIRESLEAAERQAEREVNAAQGAVREAVTNVIMAEAAAMAEEVETLEHRAMTLRAQIGTRHGYPGLHCKDMPDTLRRVMSSRAGWTRL